VARSRVAVWQNAVLQHATMPLLFGIRAQDFPTTWTGFMKYNRAMWRDTRVMVVGGAARRIGGAGCWRVRGESPGLTLTCRCVQSS
jgi:hypothetical protein